MRGDVATKPRSVARFAGHTALIEAAMLGSVGIVLYLADADDASRHQAILVAVLAMTALLSVGYVSDRPAALGCALGALVLLTGLADSLELGLRDLNYEPDPAIPYTLLVLPALPSVVLIFLGQMVARARKMPG